GFVGPKGGGVKLAAKNLNLKTKLQKGELDQPIKVEVKEPLEIRNIETEIKLQKEELDKLDKVEVDKLKAIELEPKNPTVEKINSAAISRLAERAANDVEVRYAAKA